MMHYQVLCIAVMAAVASCEPPVQGYNYQPPRNNVHNNYHTPTNNYLPPNTGLKAPSNNYLPPASYNPSYTNTAPSHSHTGPSYHHNTGSNYHTGSGYGGTGSGHSGAGHHDHHGHGSENEVPKSYEFGYSVKDAQSGNDYDRRESSDGNVVRGEYRVQLPDGRTQIVTYHADWQTGFHADVRYEGEARYPEPTHNHHQGGYNYNAPSDFSGSLNGFQGNTYKPSTAYGPPGYH